MKFRRLYTYLHKKLLSLKKKNINNNELSHTAPIDAKSFQKGFEIISTFPVCKYSESIL